ncbi:acyl-CoA dehydrogenase family protein [Ancylobacter sp. WKF20]|uniref:acyl-CoA dehydrogenase family protein n=1 Tax=Ancylobacter sp. WKF20 TaxID=3039801 RepID=UPI0024341979|nr:acyl-CoA dehydrogenase family protein [Ancylobacter sp. WKF20]WGD28312.1 acyl-CoA dehydrogenase family protein [Ancylobacter sp. WKF20]
MNKPVDALALLPPADGEAELARLQPLFDQIEQGAAERERERILPFAEVALLREAGYGALRLPRADHAGLSLRQLLKIVIRLGAADSNVAHIFRNHFSVNELYVRRARDAQGRIWQNAVAGGAVFGLGNIELGAKTAGGVLPSTTLTPEGEGFRLNGTKYYTTGTLYADYVLVRAATPDERLASVIIPVGRDGIEIVDDWDGIGQRLTASGTGHFRHVRVERAEAVFDADGVGYGHAYSNTLAQLYVTAIVAGIARAVLTDARRLLLGRRRTFYYANAERPADDPLLLGVLGELATDAFAAEAAVLAAAEALDAVAAARDSGRDDPELAHDAALAAAKAKLIADELAIRGGGRIFDLAGASSASRANNLDRHWRNARTLATHNPGVTKAAAIGAFEANGTRLPAKGFF